VTTIRDIARESGYSVSTVSRVLARHPDVAGPTAAAVQAVIDKHHFFVNRNARNLKRSATTTILVMIKGRNNMLFASMLERVQTAISGTGYTVAAQYLDEDDNEVAEAERLVPEIKPCGVLFLGGDAGHLAEQTRRIGEECPAVVLTTSLGGLGRPAISAVTTDDRAAARLATEHLITAGHRAIGVIGGNPEHSMMSRHRQEGVLTAVRAAGLELDLDTNYAATRYDLRSGYEAARRLTETAPGITAIYAMSDIMALGALRALHEAGLAVPDDISLIGHDGIELASYTVPRLVTIRQPQQLMAERGVAILMRHINGDVTPVEEIVDAEIVPGESVRVL